MANTDSSSDAAIAAAVALLEAHPDFRLLRRLEIRSEFEQGASGPISSAAIIDTETTGTRHGTDRIIEVGIVRFDFNVDTGRVLRVTDVYSGLEDPGFPIPPESTEIHGITDAMVAGKSLDEARIAAIMDGVTLVIAHNASFDRPFLEDRMPLFSNLAWGCSLEQVPWSDEGFRGAKLEYLCSAVGFFYGAHRSEVDCRALLELLHRPLPRSGKTGLRRLMDAASEPALRLWATGSPFETKDVLRERNYRWDADRRCWHRVVPKSAAKAESEWLKAEVYSGRAAQIEVEVLDSRVRFSGRPGPRKARVL